MKLKSIIYLLLVVVNVGCSSSYNLTNKAQKVINDFSNIKSTEKLELLDGTPYSTPAFIFDSKKSGKTVMILGGTHGNEFTGAYLAQYWLKNAYKVQRSSFETQVLFANQKAFKAVRRYIDRDLNRSCSHSLLGSDSSSHEQSLAQELNSLIGPKADNSKNSDFVIDLHTTTANMGVSLVISNENELTWLAATYLTEQFPDLKIYRWQGDEEDAFVDSLGSDGFAIEVGAIAQGVLRADIYKQTEKVVYKLLNFLELYNNSIVDMDRKVTIYDHVKLVDYPRDNKGELLAMIHPNRQDMDFKEINKGDEMFLTFDGQSIVYDADESLYGLFINEAAYYEKGFAMCLARKIEYTY
jgi:aspartoacylase